MQRTMLSASALIVIVAATVSGQRNRRDEPPAPSPRTGLPPCIAVEQHAPYRGLGYNHVVTLRSTCSRDYSCSVRTNAAPQPVRVAVSAGGNVSVTTFVGSPAREFTVTVACE